MLYCIILIIFLNFRPESVARAMVKIIKNAKTGTVWVAEGGEDPYEYILPERESLAPKLMK